MSGKVKYYVGNLSVTLILLSMKLSGNLVMSHARIQDFLVGGPDQSDKKALTTFLFFIFSPQLILQKSNGQFQRNLSFFQGSRGGPTFSRGGGPTFSRGVQLLIPYRNPYNL